MINIFLITLTVAAWLGSSRGPREAYDLAQPDRVMVLPDTLHEVSGISVTDSLIACVQDENGIIFMYDPVQQKIRRQVTFGPDGDYEDIAWANGAYYVLRSDGLIYKIRETGGRPEVSSYFTGIPAKNSEGLCYDARKNALLIAVKGKSGKGKMFRDQREVYAFDLKTGRLQQKPVLVMNTEQMKEFAAEKNISLPVKFKKKGKVSETVLKLTSSAIAIHPITGEIYLLSSTDRLLLVFESDYTIKDMIKLDPYRFNKAEGLDFSSKGELFISNEGQHREPTILSFALKK